MKPVHRISFFIITNWLLVLGSWFLLLFTACSPKSSEKLPVDWVNPNIGTISHLLTTTTAEAYMPHSMMHIAPITVPGVNDKFLAQKIYGFPIGNASFMPVSQKYTSTPDSVASSFDRDFEVVKPFYISETLDDDGISINATGQKQSAWYRVSYPSPDKRFLVLFLPGKGGLSVDSTAISGWNRNDGTTQYFYLQFTVPFKIDRVLKDSLFKNGKYEGANMVCMIRFPETGNMELKAGVSFIDEFQAKQNAVTQLANHTFDEVVDLGKKEWNSELGKIEVVSDNSNQKTIFYTALYRGLNTMRNVTENGRYFSVFDHKVHESGGRDFYLCDGLWDSYRVKHPLQLLLNPSQQEDMLESYARMYKQYGTMPLFPFPNGELTYMLGNHLAAFAADTWFKGYHNFDLKTIFEGLKKNALECTMLPDVNAPKTELDDFYQKSGYFPALKETDVETVKTVSTFYRRQAVAVTLENSFDDYCIAQLANELGLKDDAALFMKRAGNYANVFNARTRFMSPKMADGNWVPGYNPITGGRQAGRDYFAECNSWVYTFNVQHDIVGLINLFGSRKAFTAKLDSLFDVQYQGYKFDFQKQFPDMTGLTGMYSQGNEPAFHIPYLYCYAGEPWKTQKIVRQLMDAWYFNHPMGLCGDDDDGTLSAWYVFSAMGFYPVSPGMPFYVIGSPLFQKSILHLANNNTFVIEAKNVSKQNKYIQSATLQGKDWNKPWFAHEDMMKGGSLTLIMGPKPNKLWGAGEDAAPPSMKK